MTNKKNNIITRDEYINPCKVMTVRVLNTLHSEWNEKKIFSYFVLTCLQRKLIYTHNVWYRHPSM